MGKTAIGTDDRDGPWMSTAEAAQYLGITPRTLYRLIDAEELPAYRFGRVVRLRQREVFELRLRIEGDGLGRPPESSIRRHRAIRCRRGGRRIPHRRVPATRPWSSGIRRPGRPSATAPLAPSLCVHYRRTATSTPFSSRTSRSGYHPIRVATDVAIDRALSPHSARTGGGTLPPPDIASLVTDLGVDAQGNEPHHTTWVRAGSVSATSGVRTSSTRAFDVSTHCQSVARPASVACSDAGLTRSCSAPTAVTATATYREDASYPSPRCPPDGRSSK
jgi:excisionase family DNA binding protein